MKPDELVVGWVEYILKCPLNGDGEKGKEKDRKLEEGWLSCDGVKSIGKGALCKL